MLLSSRDPIVRDSSASLGMTRKGEADHGHPERQSRDPAVEAFVPNAWFWIRRSPRRAPLQRLRFRLEIPRLALGMTRCGARGDSLMANLSPAAVLPERAGRGPRPVRRRQAE